MKPSWVGYQRAGAILGLCLLWSGTAGPGAQEPSEAKTEFLRFVETGFQEGHVDTSVTTYRSRDGVDVDLVAAIHIGDQAYYEDLNRRFEAYDAVLYEMVRMPPPPDSATRRPRPRSPNSLRNRGRGDDQGRVASYMFVGQMQQSLKQMLDLEFQLEQVDYDQPNMVHADMDAITFARMQRNKGESFMTLMFQMMMNDWRMQLQGKSTSPSWSDLMGLFFSGKDRTHALKWLFAKQFSKFDLIMSGIESGADGEGTVIIVERNRVALKVLEQQIAKKKRKLAIFYGAGHMADLEAELLKRGFKKTRHQWVKAWDLQTPAAAASK